MPFSKIQNKDLAHEAKILKTLGHPVRLKIVAGLLSGNCCVNEMSECLNIPQTTISQHLALLRSMGIVEGKRTKTTVTYSVANRFVQKLVSETILSR
jgi:DNA-binding transcriptional ArsR family regulator